MKAALAFRDGFVSSFLRIFFIVLICCTFSGCVKIPEVEPSSIPRTEEESLFVLPNDVDREIWRLIQEAIKENQDIAKPDSQAVEYTRLLQELYESNPETQRYRPAYAKLIPFESFLTFQEHPAYSVLLTAKDGKELILSLADPSETESEGTIHAGEAAMFTRGVSHPKFSKDAYLEQFQQDDLENRIASALEVSDLVEYSDTNGEAARFYLNALANVYVFNGLTYHNTAEIHVIARPEGINSRGKRMALDYALQFTDRSGDIIVVYLSNIDKTPNFIIAFRNNGTVYYSWIQK